MQNAILTTELKVLCDRTSITEIVHAVLAEIGTSPTVVRQGINQLPGLRLL